MNKNENTDWRTEGEKTTIDISEFVEELEREKRNNEIEKGRSFTEEKIKDVLTEIPKTPEDVPYIHGTVLVFPSPPKEFLSDIQFITESNLGRFQATENYIYIMLTAERAEAYAALIVNAIKKLKNFPVDSTPFYIANGDIILSGSRYQPILKLISDMTAKVNKFAAGAVEKQEGIFITDNVSTALDHERARTIVDTEKESTNIQGVWRLTRIEEQKGTFEIGGPKFMYGRDSEFNALKKYLEDTFTTGSTAALEGSAGIGKTRMIHEIMRFFEKESKYQDFKKFYIPALEGFKNRDFSYLTYFGGFLTQLLEQFKLELDNFYGQLKCQSKRSEKQLRAYNEMKTLFNDLKTFNEGGAELFRKDPYKLAGRIKSIIEWLAEYSPILIAADDVQWADEKSAGVIAQILLSKMRNVFVIVSAREGEEKPSRNLDALFKQRKIQLSPLDLSKESAVNGEKATLLEQFTWDLLDIDLKIPKEKRILSDRLRNELEKSKGNPFILSEIIQLLISQGCLEKGSAELVKIPKKEIPSEEEKILAARIRRLAPLEKRLVKKIAAITPCSGLFLRYFLTHEEHDILRNLLEEQIIVIYPFVDFAHPRLKEVAKKIYINEIKEFSGTVAKRLDESPENILQSLKITPLEIFRYANEAGDNDLKSKHASSAGNIALGLYLNNEAREILEYYLPVASTKKELYETNRNLGIVYSRVSGGNPLDFFRNALKFLEQKNMIGRFDLYKAIIEACYMQRTPDSIKTMLDFCKRSSDFLEERKNEFGGKYNIEKLWLELNTGKAVHGGTLVRSPGCSFQKALGKFNEVLNNLKTGESIENMGVYLETHRMMGMIYLYNHPFEDGEALMKASDEIPEFQKSLRQAKKHFIEYIAAWRKSPDQIPDTKQVIGALMSLARTCGLLKEHGESYEYYEEARSITVKLEQYKVLGDILNSLGGVVLDEGEQKKSIEIINRAVECLVLSSREAGITKERDVLRYALLNLSLAYFARANLPEADKKENIENAWETICKYLENFTNEKKENLLERKPDDRHWCFYGAPAVAKILSAAKKYNIELSEPPIGIPSEAIKASYDTLIQHGKSLKTRKLPASEQYYKILENKLNCLEAQWPKELGIKV